MKNIGSESIYRSKTVESPFSSPCSSSRSSQRHSVVQNSMDIFHAAKNLMPNVSVMHVDESEVINTINEIQPWNNVNNIKGIRDAHCISCKDGIHIQIWPHAKSLEFIVETWYPDIWNVVKIDKNKMSIKLQRQTAD